MKKIIVSGCSITHGAETVNGFMHPDNVKHSYSFHLSQWLGVDLSNVALSGSSNDYILHSLIDQIDKNDPEQIHSVLAAWTSVNRLHWINKGRHWFFIPGWASSMNNLYDWNFYQHPNSQAFITGDSQEILDILNNQHRFFIDNYLDDAVFLNKRLSDYKSLLQSYCDIRHIRLVQIDILDYWSKKTHPNAEDHLALAHKLHKDFF